MQPIVPIGTPCPHPCPLCGRRLRLKSSRWGLYYGCDGFPHCKVTHGAHANGEPLGIPADHATRKLRCRVHDEFDTLWKPPDATMTRGTAYRQLATLLDLTRDECHIGRFDAATCKKAIEAIQRWKGER